MDFKNPRSKKIIWIDRINTFHGLFFFLLSAIRNIEVRFDENIASKKEKQFFSFLNKLKKVPFIKPANLVLNQKNVYGYALEYQRLNNISQIIELLNTSVLSHEPPSIRNMTASYLSAYLERNITFLTMVEEEIKKNSAFGHEIFISGNFANNYVLDYFRKKDIIIRQSGVITSYLRQISKLILTVLRVLFYQLFFRKIVGNIEKFVLKPSLWIEFETSFGIWGKFKESLSIISRAIDYQIVYYFDRPDTPCNDNNVNYIKKLGFNWIDIHNLIHANISLKDFREIFSILKKKLNMPLWFVIFYFHYEFVWRAYHNLYKCFNVKVLLQHQEWNWIQQAQAKAIEKAGGIMIGIHWSNYQHYQYGWHLNPQHVFFVWGKAHYELLKKDNHCEVILPCGLWIQGDNDKLDNIRKKLSNDISYVIAIFDSSVSYDIYQSPETLSQFYINMLELIAQTPQFGGLIKSKKYNMEIFDKLPDSAQIMSLLESLVDSKRLLILDTKSCSPVTAARAADISVCYGINSAGIIAGLHGCRVIHWDCTGWLKYPIYKDIEQRVFFSTLKEFNKAILDAALGDKSIGDFNKWKKIINYFNDSDGINRIVKFIEHFMIEINNGNIMPSAMEKVVNEYIEEYRIEKDWFNISGWWDKNSNNKELSSLRSQFGKME